MSPLFLIFLYYRGRYVGRTTLRGGSLKRTSRFARHYAVPLVEEKLGRPVNPRQVRWQIV